MIASLQRQIASLRGVINTLRRERTGSRGEAAPTRPTAAAAARAASTTAAAKAKAATTATTAAADKAAASTSRAATTWQLAGQSHGRRFKNAQAKQVATVPRDSPPAPQSPCVKTGTGSGQRSLEHRDRCLYRSGLLYVHMFVVLLCFAMYILHIYYRLGDALCTYEPRFPQKPQFGTTASLVHSVQYILLMVLCYSRPCLADRQGQEDVPARGTLGREGSAPLPTIKLALLYPDVV